MAKQKVAKKPAAKKKVAKKPAVKKPAAKKTASKTAKKALVLPAGLRAKDVPTGTGKIEPQKNETWKKIKTIAPQTVIQYMVSDQGRIKVVNKKSKDERLIKGTFTKGGYHQFSLKQEDATRETFYMHRIVATTFLPKKKQYEIFVCHMNGKKQDNNVKNLKWCTRREWSQLHKKLGTYKNLDRKNGGYNAKLSIDAVKDIKKALDEGKKTKTSLALKHGVSITQINRIDNGENWSHIKY